MLCQVCGNIEFDQLIPTDAKLAAFVLSGTQHHETFANLVTAAESGCELCKAIQKSVLGPVSLLESFMSYPVHLKMRLKGQAYAGYRGASDLWVLCLGKTVAKLELYVPRGMQTE